MSLQKIATLISSITAFLLLMIKFFIWIFSGSIAVLSSAIDSLLDLFVSLFNYFAIYSSEKNPDNKFNYGRWKIEALASLFEWLIIAASWIFIIYTAIDKLIHKQAVEFVWIAVIVMLISVIITGWLVYFLWYVSKKTNNIVIQSDALHYKTDLYSNMWILLWLTIIHFTGWFYIDGIIGIIIGCYIIYSAWDLIKKWYLLLLDVSLDQSQLDQIEQIIKKQPLVTWFHELKTRQSWDMRFVEMHLVFTPDIKLIDAHRIADHIEYSIPNINKKYTRKIMIHLDPYDDSYLDKKKLNW